MLLALALSLLTPQTIETRLFKGGEPASGSVLGRLVPRYFDVSEAVLDADAPNAPTPLEFASAVGPRRPLLLRFGLLDAVVPWQGKVGGAVVRLSSADGSPIEIASIRRVVAPWKPAGPAVLTGRIRSAGVAKGKETKGEDGKAPEPKETRTAATWRSAEAGRAWGRPGALGETDSLPIEGATFMPDARGVTISGLGATVQNMADRPWENGGFLIEFKSPATIGSSLSPKGRPELDLTWSLDSAIAGSDLAVTALAGNRATVTNLGSATSPPYRVRAVLDGRRGNWSAPQPTLAPDAKAEIVLPDGDVNGSKGARLVVEVDGGGTDSRNDALLSVLGGPTVAGSEYATAVRIWNAAAEASRYSFSPEGVPVRLTFVGGVAMGALPPADSPALLAGLSKLAGAPDVAGLSLDAEAMTPVPNAPKRGAEDRFPGISGGGDARGEAAIPIQIDLPETPDEDAFLRRLQPESTGGLSRYEAAALAGGGEAPLPKVAVLRVTTPGARPLANTTMRVYAGLDHAPKGEVKTDANGIVVLSGAVMDTPLLAFVASANGETEVGFVKGARLRGAVARGNAAPVMELRLNLPTLPIARDTVLSSAKFVTDSLGSAPNKLGALLDENAGTTFSATYPAGGWIEVDLGRDRTVGEVAFLAAAMPGEFEWRLRGTGEAEKSSGLWAREGDWAWTRRNRPDDVLGAKGVLYRGTAERGRYLRLVFPEGGAVRIGAIRVFAAQIGSSG